MVAQLRERLGSLGRVSPHYPGLASQRSEKDELTRCQISIAEEERARGTLLDRTEIDSHDVYVRSEVKPGTLSRPPSVQLRETLRNGYDPPDVLARPRDFLRRSAAHSIPPGIDISTGPLDTLGVFIRETGK